MKTWAVFVLLCNIAVDVTAVNCPQLWTLINGRCFYFVRRGMTWNQAQDYCQSMGGNLASIENINEYRLIQKFIRSVTNDLPVTWTGGRNPDNVRVWRWIDGREVTFTYWCPAKPNNGVQKCLVINYLAEKCWNDVDCDGSNPSLCAMRTVSSSNINTHVNPFAMLLSLLAFSLFVTF